MMDLYSFRLHCFFFLVCNTTCTNLIVNGHGTLIVYESKTTAMDRKRVYIDLFGAI